MENEIVEINIFYKKQGITSTLKVDKINDSTFKMIDNDIVNYDLTFGTEFQTEIDENGNHRIVAIFENSNFITKRFSAEVGARYRENETLYHQIGSKLDEKGGFWQIDEEGMITVNGGMITLNIPKNTDFNEFISEYCEFLTEIVDELKL